MKSNLNMQKVKIYKAFTLIEMLVVISLIGILAALALVSFSSVQKQARDTSRKSDLKQYQTAIENYASKNNGNYPVYASAITLTGALTFCGSTQLGLGNCLPDPKDVAPYQYRYVSNGVNYVLWGGLEKSTTTTYWVICSNGKNSERPSAPSASSSVCPIP